MKIERIVKELEEIATLLGIRVRREKGPFKSGLCTIRDEAYILLNKQHPIEVHLSVLAECLRHLPMDTVFLKPKVRSVLETAWTEHPMVQPASDHDY